VSPLCERCLYDQHTCSTRIRILSDSCQFWLSTATAPRVWTAGMTGLRQWDKWACRKWQLIVVRYKMTLYMYVHNVTDVAEKSVVMIQTVHFYASIKGAPEGGGGCRAVAPPNLPEPKFKKHRFCRYCDIRCFMWFTLQPKPVTEIGWWLVH
jgi:hypothetical protein